MKFKKELLIIFAITFVLAWLFGVLRFEYEWANILFNVLLFPFGLIYSTYESYCTANLSSSHFLNNEFLQLLLFGFSIIAQTVLYLYVFRQIKKLNLKPSS